MYPGFELSANQNRVLRQSSALDYYGWRPLPALGSTRVAIAYLHTWGLHPHTWCAHAYTTQAWNLFKYHSRDYCYKSIKLVFNLHFHSRNETDSFLPSLLDLLLYWIALHQFLYLKHQHLGWSLKCSMFVILITTIHQTRWVLQFSLKCHSNNMFL